jgi:hypothetical protein
MLMIWDPVQILCLAAIAMAIAFLVAGEMFEAKEKLQPVPVRIRKEEAEDEAPMLLVRPLVPGPFGFAPLRDPHESWRASRVEAEADRQRALD